jgi:threonine dehydrogenase-like Zn-dependent dehydrogenase
MPLELIADQPSHAVLRPYVEPALAPGQIRIRTLFSAVKHGTELRSFTAGSLDSSRPWDWDLRLHDRSAQSPPPKFPQPLGNMCVGEVVERGPGATRFQVGDRVYGHIPTRETHAVDEGLVKAAPAGASAQALMYIDPATFALGGVRDGNVRVGDRVAVFGLGAIGQVAVQLAKRAGASLVVAVDLFERRRAAAARHGADLTIDPKALDAGLELKRLTGTLGMDVTMETSGSSHAFYDALRSLRYGGTLVSLAYYMEPMNGLFFSGEFHRNRPRIVSSRACSEPNPEFGWHNDRMDEEVTRLLVGGQLAVDDLIDPIVPFARAAEAYHEINQHPERSIKLGFDFGATGVPGLRGRAAATREPATV